MTHSRGDSVQSAYLKGVMAPLDLPDVLAPNLFQYIRALWRKVLTQTRNLHMSLGLPINNRRNCSLSICHSYSVIPALAPSCACIKGLASTLLDNNTVRHVRTIARFLCNCRVKFFPKVRHRNWFVFATLIVATHIFTFAQSFCVKSRIYFGLWPGCRGHGQRLRKIANAPIIFSIRNGKKISSWPHIFVRTGLCYLDASIKKERRIGSFLLLFRSSFIHNKRCSWLSDASCTAEWKDFGPCRGPVCVYREDPSTFVLMELFVSVKENTNGRPQPLLQEPHYGSRPQPYSKCY
jgi:hypothetical protein